MTVLHRDSRVLHALVAVAAVGQLSCGSVGSSSNLAGPTATVAETTEGGPTAETPALRSITVVLVAAGETYQASAVGGFSDGSSRQLTTDVEWNSSNPAVAVVSSEGAITPLTVGTTEIRATYLSITGSAPLAVAHPVPPPAPPEVLVTGTVRDAWHGDLLAFGMIERIQEGSAAGDRIQQSRGGNCPRCMWSNGPPGNGNFEFPVIAGQPFTLRTDVVGFVNQTRELTITEPTTIDFALVPLPVSIKLKAYDVARFDNPRCFPIRFEFIGGPNAGREAVLTSGEYLVVTDLQPTDSRIRVSVPSYQTAEATINIRPDPDYPDAGGWTVRVTRQPGATSCTP